MALLQYYSFEAGRDGGQTPALVNQGRTNPPVYSSTYARAGSRSVKSVVDGAASAEEYFKSGKTHPNVPFAYNQGANSETYWCGISLLVPDPYPIATPSPKYEIPLQMHGYPPVGVNWPDYPSQSPPISFHLEPTSTSGGTLKINIQSISKAYAQTVKQEPSKVVSIFELGEYVCGQWLDIVLAAKFDYRDAYGRTRVWLDGTKVLDKALGNYFNGHGQPYFWFGLYTGWRTRASVTKRTVYHDEYRIAVGESDANFDLVDPAQADAPAPVLRPAAPTNMRAR